MVCRVSDEGVALDDDRYLGAVTEMSARVTSTLNRPAPGRRSSSTHNGFSSPDETYHGSYDVTTNLARIT